jgi:hypothetical protein
MNVCIYTSMSPGCADFAAATTPSKLRYCLRHGYSLVLRNRPYHEAVLASLDDVLRLLDQFDMVWTLDADCLITGTAPIHKLPGLGEHVTVCEESIVDWNRINCGSMVWRRARETTAILRFLINAKERWRRMPCGWQTLLGDISTDPISIGGWLAVLPPRSFNSVAWNHSGGGSHWQPGDLVYHPCGIVPHSLRAAALREVAATLEATP